MRSFVFVISLLSFVMYRAADLKGPLQGTWNGSYRTAEKKADLRIIFGPGNEVELYSSEFEKAGKAVGTYAVNKNEIAITCLWPDSEYISFIMKGRLSQKQNFVNGNWESEDNPGGNFYMAKAGSK